MRLSGHSPSQCQLPHHRHHRRRLIASTFCVGCATCCSVVNVSVAAADAGPRPRTSWRCRGWSRPAAWTTTTRRSPRRRLAATTLVVILRRLQRLPLTPLALRMFQNYVLRCSAVVLFNFEHSCTLDAIILTSLYEYNNNNNNNNIWTRL